MTVGLLGEVVFLASEELIRTVSDMKWSGSARWETHARLGGDALTEFGGLDPDQISFNIYLSMYLGVDPMTEISRLWKYEREGTPVFLVLGDHSYGRWKWVLQSHSTTVESYDGTGNIATCTVSLKLLEYLME